MNQIPTVGGNNRTGWREPARVPGRGGTSRQRAGVGRSFRGGARFAMREMRATRGVGSGARTDVGRPALAGVLVEECDGWRGGIHGGCVSRVLWVSRRVTLSDTRGERYFPDTNDISGCPFVFSELPLWDQPRRDVPQRTTTTTSMCIVPTDTSDCTHVMQRGASAAGNDGYAGIGPSRYPTRAPAAWTREEEIFAQLHRNVQRCLGRSNARAQDPGGGPSTA